LLTHPLHQEFAKEKDDAARRGAEDGARSDTRLRKAQASEREWRDKYAEIGKAKESLAVELEETNRLLQAAREQVQAVNNGKQRQSDLVGKSASLAAKLQEVSGQLESEREQHSAELGALTKQKV
jgi:hypothetical protein